MAAPLDRHRTSLGVIFSQPQGLPSEVHDQATRLFDRLMNHFEPSQTSDKSCKLITLIRLTKQGVYVKDDFLILFFNFIGSKRLGAKTSLAETLVGLRDFEEWTFEERYALYQHLDNFAGFLIDNFFLPRMSLMLKVLAAKTPQSTPALVSRLKESEQAIGTPQRLSNLRKTCLARDQYRCVVTRKFDVNEAEKRYDIDGEDMKDDDGDLLLPEAEDATYLKMAHIIPHSLMSHSDSAGESKLSERKQIAHKILRMFNPDAVHLISGTDIDREINALTLTNDLYKLFSNFQIAFELVPEQQHTYTIDYIKKNRGFRTQKLPVTRTLYITADRNIDPPSSQLLQLHSVIGHILYLSAAGEYLDKFIEDMTDIEEGQLGQLFSDGSTRIDDYVRYKLASDVHHMVVC